MAGRRIPSESAWRGGLWDRPDCARRRDVLRELLARLEGGGRARYAQRAQQNLTRWRAAAGSADVAHDAPRIRVVPDDWGVATERLTRETGACCAVLNMANAYGPGGAYVEGAPAQEENLFRRTDAHYSIDTQTLDPRHECYPAAMTALLEAAGGRVYLDTTTPRVCVRGPEDRKAPDLGYRWLADDEVFPFYELRAAAVDRRSGAPFDPIEMRRRIDAQLLTLRDAGVEHAVLSAFGCGAFGNPAAQVAALYRDALREHGHGLREVVFAVYYPGYGPDNYTPFAAAFAG